MSRGAKYDNNGLPSWYRGRLRNDDITDEWAGEREGKFTEQRGIRILSKNFDNVINEQFKGLGHISPTSDVESGYGEGEYGTSEYGA